MLARCGSATLAAPLDVKGVFVLFRFGKNSVYLRWAMLGFFLIFLGCSDTTGTGESIPNPKSVAEKKSAEKKSTHKSSHAEGKHSQNALELELSPTGTLELVQSSGPPIPVRNIDEKTGLRGGAGHCESDGNHREATGWAGNIDKQKRPQHILAVSGRNLKVIESEVDWMVRAGLEKNESLGKMRFDKIGFRLKFKFNDVHMTKEGVRFFVVFDTFAEQLPSRGSCADWLPKKPVRMKEG